MNKSYTFTKGNVEIYRIRTGHTWADIVIDELSDRRGQIFINSDYGSWAYHWGSIGSGGIKQFLLEADNAYIMGKFGKQDTFDSEATKNSMIEHINEYVDEEDKEQLIEEVKNADWNSVDSMYYTMSDELHKAFPEYPPVVMSHNVGLIMFMDTMFAMFREILAEELAVKA